MVEVRELRYRMDLFDEAVEMFWSQWGSETNFAFYQDCIKHSCSTDQDLPRFYIALREDSTLVGTYALLRSELMSRQDLFPWFACLYVVPEARGDGIGATLLQHAREETAKRGYDQLYLCTNLENYYEKYGWQYVAEGYIFNGDPTKVYVHPTDRQESE